MADIICSLSTPNEVALVAAAAAKTVLQIVGPSNHRVKVLGWGIFFDGVNTAAEPVQIRIVRGTTAATGTVATPVSLRPIADAVQTQGLHTCTVESTVGEILDVIECHPQQGFEVKFPMGQEIIMAYGGRLSIECSSPSAVNCRAKFFFEE